MSTNSSITTNGDASMPPAGLGTHSARGLVYLFAGSSAAKVVSFVANIALLYLLGRRDFGVVTLATAITAFILIIGQAGVGDVLVRRKAFHMWAIPGFWLALSLGLLSCSLILLSAPIASTVSRLLGGKTAVADQLFWVLLVLAPSPLPYALSVVPQAQLARQLRFRAIATINLANVTMQNILTVVFAALGFGPFSFVLPVTVAGLLTTVFYWWWVRPQWKPQLRVRRWRFLIGDTSQLLGAEFGRMLIEQSDYMLVGIFRSVELLGIYSVGFRFSIQMMQLLMVNLTNILFPTFMKLTSRPQQQYQGFSRAQRILAMFGVSSCLLQAATADPFVHVILPAKRLAEWEPSIIIMQILSIGMATKMIGGASFALLKSQGRFRTIRINLWSCAVVQIAMLALLLSLGYGIVAVAIAVATIASAIGPITFYLAIRPYGKGWVEVADVLTKPLTCGIVSVGTAWILAQAMAARGYGPLLQLIETGVIAVALNTALAWLWMRPVWDDFWFRVRRMLPARAVA